jgi:cell division protein FtsL
MAQQVDAQELARHQRDFSGFVRFIMTVIVLVVIVLAGMAIFLL